MRDVRALDRRAGHGAGTIGSRSVTPADAKSPNLGYGIGAVVSTVHDLFITIGIFEGNLHGRRAPTAGRRTPSAPPPGRY